jgi:hypothetical protein
MRRVIAMAFLLFLLVEWGSHDLAFSHASSAGEAAVVQSSDGNHEDPCKTLVHCPDSRQGKDQRNVQPDASQHSLYLNGILNATLPEYLATVVVVEREPVGGLSGSVDPPFHPPKNS